MLSLYNRTVVGNDIEGKVVSLTRDLVAQQTVNPPGSEELVVEVLRDRLDESPIEFELDSYPVEPGRSNLIARSGDPSQGSLLLTGHMDTVPANAAEWTHNPFKLSREDDRIIGRGVADMKAALAAKVVAAETYLESTMDPGEVVLAFVMDEEQKGRGTESLVGHELDVDAAVLGEPTDMGVGVAQKGAVRYKLVVRGRNAHSGRPDQGVNATQKLWRVLERIERLDNDMRDKQHNLLKPGSSVTVTEVEAGLAMNVVPAEATITVDWRTVPGMPTDFEWYDQQIASAVDDLMLKGELIEVEIERWSQYLPVEVMDHPIVETVAAAAREAGYGGEHVGFNAGTDARFLVHDADIPTVLFGPGDIENDAHTVEESIQVADLVGTVRTYERTLDYFLG